MSTRVYVTTTIPYVNAPPHVGHALELVQADALARWHRQQGRGVRLQTGTDENAFKNVASARAQGLGVRELVDRNAARFRDLAVQLDVSAATFLRTASAVHSAAVQTFIGSLEPEDLYRGEYRGLYCPGCEDFFREADVHAGGCPDHGKVLEETREENVFFRLSRYREELLGRIESGRVRVLSAARRAEILRFIEGGLQDISISRARDRTGGWGVPYPGDASQVVYVWIDALVNYLTGVGYPSGRGWRFWADGSRRIHVIGKNVWKFHVVYWPALLLSAGVPLPDDVFVHGFLTENGRKISKSSGRAVDPLSYVSRYGVDAVRYYLLRHVRPFEDSDFSEVRLRGVYEGDLANGLGNLLSRLTALCQRFGVGGVHPGTELPPLALGSHLEAYRFDRALDVIWQEVARLDREIAEARPWERASGAARPELERWTRELDRVARTLRPFLPRAARRVESALRQVSITRAEPLFPRIPDGARV
jgi:methionyl-tRNA synthetase